MDLLGNVAYRYEQFDGSTAMPYKEGYRYHFAGKVTVCPDTNFKFILNLLSPIFLSAQENLKIIFPPMPRHLDTTCCKNPSHCTNVRDEGYAVGLLEKITHLRKIQKVHLLEKGVKNFWLMDGIAALQGVAPPEKRGNNRESLPDLLTAIATDGVHLTDLSYRKIAGVVNSTLISLRDGKIGKVTPLASVSDAVPPKKSHFWKGFISPVGSPGSGFQNKSANHRFHPYWRPKGGEKRRN
jgi:hypothetical protein